MLPANTVDGATKMLDRSYPVSAPYLVYTSVNLLVCDLTSSTTVGTWVVPVKREVTGSTNIGGDTNIAASWLVAVPDGKTSTWASLNYFLK